MTGIDLCVNKPHKSRSYLNHLVFVLLCNLLNSCVLLIHPINRFFSSPIHHLFFGQKLLLKIHAIFFSIRRRFRRTAYSVITADGLCKASRPPFFFLLKK